MNPNKFRFKDAKQATFIEIAKPDPSDSFHIVNSPLLSNISIAEALIQENAKKIWFWLILGGSILIIISML